MKQQTSKCSSFESVNAEAEMYMQNSMITDRRQAGEEAFDPLLALLAQDGGNAYEQIDPYTLEIISKILPHSGIEFLSRILQHATVIQNVLPQLETLGERVAVLNTRTIRLLAKAIQWGYDTTHKYVNVFMSLGLLYRHKHKTGNMLVFPLNAYELPDNLHALDNLIMKSRPKVRQFARKVKERLLLHHLAYHVEQQDEAVPGPSERDINLHHLLLVSIVDVIKSEGIEAERGKHIALRLMKEVIGKIKFPRQNIAAAQKREAESSSFEQTYTSQQQISTDSNHAGKQYQTDRPVQARERNKVAVNTTPGRPAPRKVSSVIERESTQKEDFPQKSPVYASQGRLSQTKFNLPVQNLPTLEEDSPYETQEVYPESEKSNASTSQEVVMQGTNNIGYLHTKEIKVIADVLDFYYQMLESEEVDWSEIPLPKTFFKTIYGQLNVHYQRLYNNGIISRMKEYMWRSTEVSIIKKLAERYEVDCENACIYIFNLSEREYKPDLELKRNCYTPVVVPYYPPVEEEDPIAKREAEYQFLMNRGKVAQAEQEKYQSEVDQYAKTTASEVDQNQKESTSTASAGKTFKKTQMTGKKKESTNAMQKEDSLADKSSSRQNVPSYDGFPAETPQEAERRRKSEVFLAMCEPEVKPLRIPAEVDPENYLEAFYYVLRNRNINILFNNIYNNVTLRSSAAQFLTTVFDTDNSKNNINVNKQNENLLNKYKPEVVMSGFIDTVLSMHEPGYDSLQNPGAFFTSRCKFYDQNEPDFKTDELINRFANMSYSAFASEMQTLINSGQKIRTKQYKKHS